MWNLVTAALVGLNLLDYALTAVLIRRGGSGVESNPIARWVCEAHGLGGMFALKFAAVAVAVVAIRIIKDRRPLTAWGLLVSFCGLLLAVVGYSAWLASSSSAVEP